MSAMDISDEPEGGVPLIVSTTENNSGLSISVHPLVLLNVSDHFTRVQLQNKDNPEKANRVYGALLAKQSGREIDIVNSFELSTCSNEHGEICVDRAHLKAKSEQFKQVFEHLDFMGWYTLGSTPNERDLIIHREFLKDNESCLFLQLNPLALSRGIRDFPVSIYESTTSTIDGSSRLVFVKVPYEVETSEAERIAVEHVAKTSDSSADTGLGNALISHLTTQRNAIEMLHKRIGFLCNYLNDVESGAIPLDHSITRQISSICRRSPVVDIKAFDDQFSTEYNDVLLVAYLATITKGMNTVNDLVDKFALSRGGTGITSSVQPTASAKSGRVSHCSTP